MHKSPLHCRIVDCGGQLIYLSTHGIFFVRQAIYLLMFDPRHDFLRPCDVATWLDEVRARCPDAPVILVPTHADEGLAVTPSVQDLLARGRYSGVIMGPHISSKDGTGFDELMAEIESICRLRSDIAVAWPSSWVGLVADMQELADCPLKLLSRADMAALARSACRFPLAADFELALQVLHHTGHIIDGHQLGNRQLRNVLVPSPEWLGEVLASVVSALEARQHLMPHGIIKYEVLSSIFHSASGASQQQLTDLLELMHSFDIAYAIQDADYNSVELSVVPALQQDDIPRHLDWNADPAPGQLVVVYEMEYCPFDLAERLVVRLHGIVTGTSWRQGMLCERRDHAALVTVDKPKCRIFIAARGPTWPGGLLSLICSCIDTLLRERYPGQCSAVAYVGCNECNALALNVKNLVKKLNRGLSSVDCCNDHCVDISWLSEVSWCPWVFTSAEAEAAQRVRMYLDWTARHASLSLTAEQERRMDAMRGLLMVLRPPESTEPLWIILNGRWAVICEHGEDVHPVIVDIQPDPRQWRRCRLSCLRIQLWLHQIAPAAFPKPPDLEAPASDTESFLEAMQNVAYPPHPLKSEKLHTRARPVWLCREHRLLYARDKYPTYGVSQSCRNAQRMRQLAEDLLGISDCIDYEQSKCFCTSCQCRDQEAASLTPASSSVDVRCADLLSEREPEFSPARSFALDSPEAKSFDCERLESTSDSDTCIYRLGLLLPPQARMHRVRETWRLAYHGTSVDKVKAIIGHGGLLKPGETTMDGVRLDAPHTIHEPNGGPFVWVSPSRTYAGYYCTAKPLDDSQVLECIFEVYVKPDSFSMQRNSLSSIVNVDPAVPDSELEWYTNQTGSVMLSGLLMRVRPSTDEDSARVFVHSKSPSRRRESPRAGRANSE